MHVNNAHTGGLSILLSHASGSPLETLLSSRGKSNVSASITHKAYENDESKQKTEYADSPAFKARMQRFQDAVVNASSAQEALSNPAVASVLQEAYEIDILTASPEKFAKIVSTDVNDPSSAVRQSRNLKLQELSLALDVTNHGADVLKAPAFQKNVAKRLIGLDFEKKAASINPAAGDAFYFERKIPDVHTAADILVNPRLRDVAFKALGIPDSMKAQYPDEQKAAIESKLDFSRLKDLDYVRNLATTYLGAVDRAQQIRAPSMLDQMGGGNALMSLLA